MAALSGGWLRGMVSTSCCWLRGSLTSHAMVRVLLPSSLISSKRPSRRAAGAAAAAGLGGGVSPGTATILGLLAVGGLDRGAHGRGGPICAGNGRLIGPNSVFRDLQHR